MTSKTRSSRFSSTSPPQHHNRHKYAILRQINDNEASNRTVCPHTEVRWQTSVIWFDSSAKLSHVVISGGYVLLCWEVRNTNMTIVWVHARPFTTSVPHSHLHVIWGGSLMESFARLLQRLTILQVSQCFVEVDARFCRVLIRNTNIDTEQQSTTTTQWEGYQTTALGTSKRPLC